MRARPREINIFNMSLLDILCGALGAFCFMMLVALPYYVVSKGDRAESQKRTEELMKDVEKLRERMSDPQQAEELRKLIDELEAQIKQLQGQLNQSEYENQQLKGENNRLTSDNNSLRENNDKLTAENDSLRKENETNKLNVEMKKPFVVMAGAADQAQDLSIYLEDVMLDGVTEKSKLANPKFEPTVIAQPSNWIGDISNFFVPGRGVTLWVSATTMRNSAFRVFVKYRMPPPPPEQRNFPFSNSRVKRTPVHLTVYGELADENSKAVVILTPDRFWTFVGTLKIDEKAKITFKEASEAERDESWRAIMKSEPPAIEATPVPTMTPIPGVSEEEMKHLREMAAQRRKAEEERLRRERERGASPVPSASPAGTIDEQERPRRDRVMREMEKRGVPTASPSP